MIDALISGRLYGTPTERTSKLGRPFVTCKVGVTTSTGDTVFANVIAFAPPAVAALLALQDGDSAALSGELTIKTRTDEAGVARPRLDLVAAYHASRMRQATKDEARAGS
jgi:Single-strand binding protein family